MEQDKHNPPYFSAASTKLSTNLHEFFNGVKTQSENKIAESKEGDDSISSN